MTQNAYFSLITHTKQLLLVTFSDTTAGIGPSFWTQTDAPKDVDVEIVIKIGQKIFFDYILTVVNNCALTIVLITSAYLIFG